MRKLILVLFTVALALSMSSGVRAAGIDTTWTVVEGAAALGLWPNEAGSPNIFEADGGLLGRVMTAWPAGTAITDPTLANACEMAPSFPCDATNPPNFLLATGLAEGPKGAGGGVQCNVKVTACGAPGVPGAPPNNGPGYLGEDTTKGTYSYFVIHEVGGTGKGIGFFSGSYTAHNDPYLCNECAATGAGKDINNQVALDNTGGGSLTRTDDVQLWITQAVQPFGHALVALNTQPSALPKGSGKTSVCGNGVVFQNLYNDLCVDGPTGLTGNYLLTDQKVVIRSYSVNMANHANGTNPGKCNPPDCYIQNVIIPAALAQDANAKNVQVQVAATILPANAPGSLPNSTVDTLIFSYTTQLLDMDGDGTEDRNDPCPNDATDTCIQDQINGGNCPAGQVFCADSNGFLGCISSALCNSRGDVNQDCAADAIDANLVGSNDALSSPLSPTLGDPAAIASFGTGIPIGPFDP